MSIYNMSLKQVHMVISVHAWKLCLKVTFELQVAANVLVFSTDEKSFHTVGTDDRNCVTGMTTRHKGKILDIV